MITFHVRLPDLANLFARDERFFRAAMEKNMAGWAKKRDALLDAGASVATLHYEMERVKRRFQDYFTVFFLRLRKTETPFIPTAEQRRILDDEDLSKAAVAELAHVAVHWSVTP